MDPFQCQRTGFIAIARQAASVARMEHSAKRESQFATGHVRLTGPRRRNQRNPVPPQRWHLTTLSPFFSSPLPSQFLHFCFFLMFGPLSLAMVISTSAPGMADLRPDLALTGAAFPFISRPYQI